jgi:hypothetical protein
MYRVNASQGKGAWRCDMRPWPAWVHRQQSDQRSHEAEISWEAVTREPNTNHHTTHALGYSMTELTWSLSSWAANALPKPSHAGAKSLDSCVARLK